MLKKMTIGDLREFLTDPRLSDADPVWIGQQGDDDEWCWYALSDADLGWVGNYIDKGGARDGSLGEAPICLYLGDVESC